MRRWRLQGLALTTVALALGAGCASPRDAQTSRYLQKLVESQAASSKAKAEVASPDAPNAPEAPMSALPVPPTGGGEVALAPAPADGAGPEAGEHELTIQPDCVLQIKVDEDPSLNGTYAVNDIGAVQFGYIGPVILYNRSEISAARKIEEILTTSRDFRKATVRVRILRPSYDKVQIGGAVGSPGTIRIGASDTVTLNDLLLRVGGLRCSALKAKVRVVRNGLLSPLAPSLPGEEYRFVDEEGKPCIPDVRLRNNDIAFVEVVADSGDVAPARSDDMGGKTVLVLGEVGRKGFYYFGPGERSTMMNLLFKMGGMPLYAKTKAVRVVRRDKDGFEEEFTVDAQKIIDEGNPDDDFPLEDGDRVIVPARRIALF